MKNSGSLITASGQIDVDVKRRKTKHPSFQDFEEESFYRQKIYSEYQRRICQACVLSVLLYGAEYLIPLRKHIRKLKTFHHTCLRALFGITYRQQWSERITSITIRIR